MFKAVLGDSNILKTSFDAISSIVDEVQIQADSGGLRLDVRIPKYCLKHIHPPSIKTYLLSYYLLFSIYFNRHNFDSLQFCI